MAAHIVTNVRKPPRFRPLYRQPTGLQAHIRTRCHRQEQLERIKKRYLSHLHDPNGTVLIRSGDATPFILQISREDCKKMGRVFEDMANLSIPGERVTEIDLPETAAVIYQVAHIVKTGCYDLKLDKVTSHSALDVLRGIKTFVDKYQSTALIVVHLLAPYQKLARFFPFHVFIDSVGYSSLDERRAWDGDLWLSIAANAMTHWGCVTKTTEATIEFRREHPASCKNRSFQGLPFKLTRLRRADIDAFGPGAFRCLKEAVKFVITEKQYKRRSVMLNWREIAAKWFEIATASSIEASSSSNNPTTIGSDGSDESA